MKRCVITGLGGRGRYWKSIIDQSERADAVAFVEPNEAAAEKAVADAGVTEGQLFKSLGDALKAVDVDFVLDVTPPAVHHEIAEQTFAAGLHLLGEKPLSEDYATAAKVVEQGKAAGVTHMITQNYRFRAPLRMLRKLIADGRIGEPGQLDIQFYMNWADIPGSHYVTKPYMLINDMMVHHFDLMRMVLGKDPLAVTAITWNQPWGWHAGDAAHAIVFEYESGLRATHVSIGCSVGKRTTYDGDWRIEGPKGSLSFTADGIRHVHFHKAPEQIDEVIEPEPCPDGPQALLNEFLDAIEGGREPECSAADNLNSVAMVFAAIKSAKEGRRVELSELA